MPELKVVTVEIQGQHYPIKTTLDASYVHRLAAHVESRLQKAALSAPSADTVGLAILTALNITDEYFRAKSALSNNSGTLTQRAEALEKMVDQALALAE